MVAESASRFGDANINVSRYSQAVMPVSRTKKRDASAVGRQGRRAPVAANDASPAHGPRFWRPRALRKRPDGTPEEVLAHAASGVGEVLSQVLEGLGADPVRMRLIQLWRNWEMVMGPELAPLARPLGHRGDVLLIGAEDAMLMQELHLQSAEILERVNAFMEGPYFACVKVSLCFQKTALDAIRAPAPPPPLPTLRPRLDGSALRSMRPDSPVARCYARFVAQARRS